ncbi:hypothetical protein FHX08_002753 [Rhizobium sp. BK529]|nr:hypothetical protein [Rhizobium sp. BK529]
MERVLYVYLPPLFSLLKVAGPLTARHCHWSALVGGSRTGSPAKESQPSSGAGGRHMVSDPKSRQVAVKMSLFLAGNDSYRTEGIGPKTARLGTLDSRMMTKPYRKSLEIPLFSHRERPWMPSLCPGFGHQSTEGHGGNYFRFWSPICGAERRQLCALKMVIAANQWSQKRMNLLRWDHAYQIVRSLPGAPLRAMMRTIPALMPSLELVQIGSILSPKRGSPGTEIFCIIKTDAASLLVH